MSGQFFGVALILVAVFTQTPPSSHAQDTPQKKDDTKVSIDRKANLSVKYMGLEFGKRLNHPAAYTEPMFQTETLYSYSGVRTKTDDQPEILRSCHQYVLVDKKSKTVVGLTFHRRDSNLASESDFYRSRDERNDPRYKGILTAEELFILTSKALIQKYKNQVKINESGVMTSGKIRVGNHDFNVEVRHKKNPMRKNEEFIFQIIDLTAQRGDQIVVDTEKF